MCEFTYEKIDLSDEFFIALIKYDNKEIGISLGDDTKEVLVQKATLLCNLMNNTKNIPKMGWLKLPVNTDKTSAPHKLDNK